MEGIKYDDEKLLWSLVPWESMTKVCRVLTDGAKKYSADNWKKVEKKRYQEALMRHQIAYAGGEVDDPDSGSHHLAHVVANALIIMWHEQHDKDVRVPDVITEPWLNDIVFSSDWLESLGLEKRPL